jgi:hypothetical protein
METASDKVCAAANSGSPALFNRSKPKAKGEK